MENGEAGCGFVNEAYRGNLKITKDSSDGRKDGFAFEVKSEDGTYCETFTSPEDGIILIEGLRVGKYTVTEVKNKASEDYIIPDGATVEIKAARQRLPILPSRSRRQAMIITCISGSACWARR